MTRATEQYICDLIENLYVKIEAYDYTDGVILMELGSGSQPQRVLMNAEQADEIANALRKAAKKIRDIH